MDEDDLPKVLGVFPDEVLDPGPASFSEDATSQAIEQQERTE